MMQKILKLNAECESYYLNGDYNSALRTGLAALVLDKNSPIVHHNLGATYYQQNDYKKAIYHCQKAASLFTAINQYNRETIITLCNSLIMVGKLNDAKSLALQAYQGTKDIVFDGLGKTCDLVLYQKIVSAIGGVFDAATISNNIVFGAIHSYRIGHLAANTEMYLRLRQLGRIPDDKTYIFVSGENPANRQLLEMYKKHLTIIENQILFEFLMQYGPRVLNHWINTYTLYKSTEYEEFTTTDTTIQFTPEEEERGRSELSSMGIGKYDWFVCVFSRDSEYLNVHTVGADWSYHDYRDDDINTYRKAIKYIIDNGGFVVRIGQYVSQKLRLKHNRMIHYAGSDFRNDFMDIYLCAKCRFIMGSGSGIINAATDPFETPYLGINCVPIGLKPYTKKSMYIPKKIKQIESDQFLAYKSFFSEFNDRDNPAFGDGVKLKELGYLHIDNTEEEIYEATVEMLKLLENDFTFSDDDRELLERYYALYPDDHFNKKNKTPIAISFLKRNYKLFFGDE